MQITVTGTPASRAPRFISVGACLLGLLLLAGAGFAAWSEIRFRRGAVETDGRVVEMIPRSSSDRDGRRSTTYAPVFVFSVPDGKEMRVQGTVASNPPCCRVGERVRVRYDPAQPERAAMTGFVESWLVTSILAGMGIVSGGIGLVLLVVAGRAAPLVPAAVGATDATAFAVPLAGLRREQTAAGPRWILQARWADPDTGAQRLFESEPLPFDPVPQMRSMTSVQVSFDPGRPDGPYWMDLSFLREPDADATVVQRRG